MRLEIDKSSKTIDFGNFLNAISGLRNEIISGRWENSSVSEFFNYFRVKSLRSQEELRSEMLEGELPAVFIRMCESIERKREKMHAEEIIFQDLLKEADAIIKNSHVLVLPRAIGQKGEVRTLQLAENKKQAIPSKESMINRQNAKQAITDIDKFFYDEMIMDGQKKQSEYDLPLENLLKWFEEFSEARSGRYEKDQYSFEEFQKKVRELKTVCTERFKRHEEYKRKMSMMQTAISIYFAKYLDRPAFEVIERLNIDDFEAILKELEKNKDSNVIIIGEPRK